jgi:hypothetical protein
MGRQGYQITLRLLTAKETYLFGGKQWLRKEIYLAAKQWPRK